MRNLGRPGERQLGPGRDCRPSDDLEVFVGKDAGRDRAQSVFTYSPRARPTSARLVFESSRWLKHQHTEESGFLGPSMVATSSNRPIVAAQTSVFTPHAYSGIHVSQAHVLSGTARASSFVSAAVVVVRRGKAPLLTPYPWLAPLAEAGAL